MRPRILLLSAYDAESHRRWRQGLATALDADITTLALPARFFSWRVRGNPLTWWLSERKTLAAQWDLLIATSMVDLATLKGLLPSLACTPSLVYFHENQFAYPLTDRAHQSVEPQITSIYTALAADTVLFNSRFNYDSFLMGARQLLRKMPDGASTEAIDEVEQKSAILPVPIEAQWFDLKEQRSTKPVNQNPSILWNHRWEYDKGPELLLAIIESIVDSYPKGYFQWHIVGQQFRQMPDAFAKIHAQLTAAGMLGAWGYQSTDDYNALLASSDIVLSTALHDFQGLAIGEAVAAGCVPVLPNRVAYPEQFEGYALFDVTSDDIQQQAANAVRVLAKQLDERLTADLSPFSWRALAPKYQHHVDRLAKAAE